MVCFRLLTRTYCSGQVSSFIKLLGKDYPRDDFTNITPKIEKRLGRNLYLMDGHPLSFTRERIINYFHKNFKGRTGNSIFSVYDGTDPVVSTHQNFDSLLIPEDHVSRTKTNCYYVNKDYLLRSHMTAHQSELVKSGLNNFIMVGDVYRRDDVDRNHYPVFHQLDGIRLFSPSELYAKEDDGCQEMTILSEKGKERCENCQEFYTEDASKKVEEDLKNSLIGLCYDLFGNDIKHQWIDAYFPFTHPSWELEILYQDNWLEILGCGVVEYKILEKAGCNNRIGWAFGLGLERLAMISYKISDIRTFWSRDSGFLSQFQGKSYSDKIIYKPVSKFPPCINHISFWIPESYSSNDFYDLVREIGGDYVEQVHLIDVFLNQKTGKTSHCYEIIYRHLEKTFLQSEVNEIHNKIRLESALKLNVEVR